MLLKYVTFTGADNSIAPLELVDLTVEYPFVEWGILLSASSEGRTRFPSLTWMETLAEVHETFNIPLSGHICGRWVRELCKGNRSFFEERPTICKLFNRFQLNFHAQAINGNLPEFVSALQKCERKQIIFQVEGVNKHYYDYAVAAGIDAVPLFDKSGGKGIVPETWPEPYVEGDDKVLCGYAGGLGPHNIESELKRIEKVVGDSEIWLDFETHVRSNEGQLFDLTKVRKCLELVKAYA